MRFLIACQAPPGHLNPHRSLAYALRERGHIVAFYTGAGARRCLEEDGFAMYPHHPDMDRILTEILLPTGPGLTAGKIADERLGIFHKREITQALKRYLLDPIPYQIDDLQKIYADFQPDVLVSDLTLMAGCLILKDRSPVPVAVFSVILPCPIPGPGAPPWGPGLPLARSFLQRLTASVFRTASKWVLSDVRAEANALRARYGLKPIPGSLAQEYGKAALCLVMSTPSLDYCRQDLPSSVHYCGAFPMSSRHPASGPAWLEGLRPTPPVVHVTEGTIHTSQPFLLEIAIEALAGAPFQVILATGHQRTPESLNLSTAAPNIRLEQFVPYKILLPKTSVLVTTGGGGTILEALLAGIPVLVVPIGWEHAENAQRVVEAGVGLRLNPADCTPKTLRAAVERLTSDPSFQTNAQRVRKELAAQGGPLRASELLETLAR